LRQGADRVDVVTGSFGYIGKYITERLLDLSKEVKTITTHPKKPSPFGDRVKAHSYNFEKPDKLVSALYGASTLYNTYWIRFEYGGLTYGQALKNSFTLFRCAKEAGVKKIIHISVTHASVDADLPYYKGKGIQEKMLADVGVPYAIVRPTLVFGKEDILVNNIAWMIRRFPIFPVFGLGDYKVQPVFVGDLAKIATDQENEPSGVCLDAIGSETFTFEEMLYLIATKIGSTVRFVRMKPTLAILCAKIIGMFCRDVVLTHNEIKGLMRGCLTSQQAPNGNTRFSDWLEQNKEIVGCSYSSELARHFRWSAP
jgi:uncharacterized protein YbjT (DUF2867 family)